jgi:hypothetical protein
MSLNFSFGQTQYVSHATINNNSLNRTIIDTTTDTKFTLDTTQIHITAFNKSGKQLWRTDPWKDNELMSYRVKRPIIVKFDFANNEQTDNKKVIWIVYNNTQYGTIDIFTGKFTWFGQD